MNGGYSLLEANCTHPNEKLECVYFFSVEYFGIKFERGKKRNCIVIENFFDF